jgi:catechol 2,3-dioxygenase-like lactoylglutathione lyase family enzyme
MQTMLGNISLYVQDVERARQFYTDILGLVENRQRSFPPTFIMLDAGGCTLTLEDALALGGVLGRADSVELGFAVKDVEAIRERLKEQGINVSDFRRMAWGISFDAVDPDGHRLTFYRMQDENQRS